jgi:hypothetical protein
MKGGDLVVDTVEGCDVGEIVTALGGDGQRKTVAVNCGGGMLESGRAEAFSRRGSIGEDADAYLARRKGGCNREQDRDSQCPGDWPP